MGDIAWNAVQDHEKWIQELFEEVEGLKGRVRDLEEQVKGVES